MPRAARITDMHVCPKVEPGPVPHVGGPVLTGFPKVLIGYIPAARVDDQAVCVGPPDAISKGSSNVIIGNKNAARIQDPTKHGGKIVVGCPTVIIGETKQSSSLKAAAASGAPFCEECEKAKKAAEEAAKADPVESPPPPPPWKPADSIDAKTAAEAGLVPSSSPTPPGPAEPTADERALAAKPGDSQPQRDARLKVIRAFYDKYANDGLGLERADQDMGTGGLPPRPNGSPLGYGIDLGKPVQVIQFPPPAVMDQYVRHAGYPGNFCDPIGGQSGDALGLNDDPKERKAVTWKMPPGEGLYSGNGPIIETWTDRDKAILTKGGGFQVTIPDSVRLGLLCACHGKSPCA